MASDTTTVTEKAGSGFNPSQFVTETRREIAKVTWPSRKETMQMTAMIVIMALVTGVFFFAVDSGLGFVIGRILGMRS